jgi:ubiquitin C
MGSIFHVKTISSKAIKGIAYFNDEEEVILLPYTSYEVEDVSDVPGEPLIIKLKEIPVPKTSRIILWVDDNPENNYIYA